MLDLKVDDGKLELDLTAVPETQEIDAEKESILKELSQIASSSTSTSDLYANSMQLLE